MTSSGVPMAERRGLATSSPVGRRISPLRMATRKMVDTASRIFSFLPCPISMPMTTLTPRERPTNRETIRLIGALLSPTAASAVELEKRPTTARSALLKSCCRMLVRASGRENRKIFPASGPFSISIS